MEQLGKSIVEEYKNKRNKPNIFKVLNLSNYEIKHSDFLAWLFDPNGTHGFGNYFFKLFITNLFSAENKNVHRFKFNENDFENVEKPKREEKTKNEDNNGLIDINITGPNHIWVIENKYGASETKQMSKKQQDKQIGQLKIYKQYVDKRCKKIGKTPVYIYLDISNKNFDKNRYFNEEWSLATYRENVLPCLLKLKEEYENQNINENQKSALKYVNEYIDILCEKYCVPSAEDEESFIKVLSDETQFKYYKKYPENVIHDYIWWTVPYKYGKVIELLQTKYNLEKIGGWTQEFVIRTLACVTKNINPEKVKFGNDENTDNIALILHFVNEPQKRSLKLNLDFTKCANDKKEIHNEILKIAKKINLKHNKHVDEWKALQEVKLLSGDEYFEAAKLNEDDLFNQFTDKINSSNIIKNYNDIICKLNDLKA